MGIGGAMPGLTLLWGGEAPLLGGQSQQWEEAMAPEDQAGVVRPQPFRGSG